MCSAHSRRRKGCPEGTTLNWSLSAAVGERNPRGGGRPPPRPVPRTGPSRLGSPGVVAGEAPLFGVTPPGGGVGGRTTEPRRTGGDAGAPASSNGRRGPEVHDAVRCPRRRQRHGRAGHLPPEGERTGDARTERPGGPHSGLTFGPAHSFRRQ